jgi:hypothetical protein
MIPAFAGGLSGLANLGTVVGVTCVHSGRMLTFSSSSSSSSSSSN